MPMSDGDKRASLLAAGWRKGAVVGWPPEPPRAGDVDADPKDWCSPDGKWFTFDEAHKQSGRGD